MNIQLSYQGPAFAPVAGTELGGSLIKLMNR
jgi:hypothetical protein